MIERFGWLVSIEPKSSVLTISEIIHNLDVIFCLLVRSVGIFGKRAIGILYTLLECQVFDGRADEVDLFGAATLAVEPVVVCLFAWNPPLSQLRHTLVDP
jgi:hypothetical protein